MTISITESVVPYIGDGVQTEFPVNYRFFADTNLLVYLDGVLQTYVTDYTVSNSGEETGSSVTFLVPPPAPTTGANGIITIERLLSNQQLLDLIEFDRFPAESVEAALDYIVLLIQQNTTANSTAIGLPAGSPLETLDFPNPGAGEFVKYTDDGLELETADINELGTQIIPTATDGEIVAGVQPQPRLVSPYQTKLAVDTHQDPPITSVFNVAWVQVVDTLPGTPDASTMYLVRQ